MSNPGNSSNQVRSYQDLKVWQLGMNISKEVYRLTGAFPKHELYGITSQLRRSVTSIPANIAEGHSRNATKEFMRFLSITTGSLSECETFMLLSEELEYVSRDTSARVLDMLSEEGRMNRRLTKVVAE